MISYDRGLVVAMKGRLLATVAVLIATALPVLSAPPDDRVKPRPRVAVAIVVDQLAAWITDDRLPLLPSTGGFARLRREGTWVKSCLYEHSMTETSPGHASLYTGVTPREHGIYANDIFEPAWNREAAMIEDPDTKLVGAAGPLASRSGVSLKRLRAKTIADRLMARDPASSIVSLSLKDRGAVFAASPRANGRRSVALWYDSVTGKLVTSTAFGNGIPAWARKLDGPVPPKIDWTLGADAEFVKAHAGTPDDQVGESADLGKRAFPHQFVPTAKTFRATPDADTFLVSLALAAVDDACGQPAKGDTTGCRLEHPFLLALSLSANDYIGHRFGPDSWEAWDELVKLDRELARLFLGLDAKFGADGWSAILTGDHGIAPLPETFTAAAPSWCAAGVPNPYEKPCSKGTRLSSDGRKQKLNAALAAALGEQGAAFVTAVVDSLVFLDHDRLERLEVARRAVVDRTIRDTLIAEPGIGMVIALSDFDAGCPALDGADGVGAIRAVICRSTGDAAHRIGDYYIVQKPGSFFTGPPDVVSHGTPYRYDRAVPLLVRSPGSAGGRELPETTFRSFTASVWFALTGETELEGVRAVGLP
jgi:hypothetical protein